MKFRIATSILAVPTFFLAAVLSGCGMGNSILTNGSAGATSNVQGTVFGGQQPIVGAHVYLMGVGATGYGGPGISPAMANGPRAQATPQALRPASNLSVSLLTSGSGTDSVGTYVLTDGNGAFNLAGKYTCTTSSQQVYVLALGGYGAQSGTTTSNAASGLMAAIGPCGTPAPKIALNEVTTVAMAYAFAGFASDATHISSSGSALALTNLANAYTNASTLVNVATGSPMANTATVTVPAATIYTLADILAACVNSNGGGASSCPTLFSYTMSGGATGTAATETASAAINLAHNPYPTAAGVTALYGLVPGTAAPYAGGLATQPNEFTVGLNYTVGSGPSFGGLNNAQITIDAGGKAWVLSNGNAAGGGAAGMNSAVISVAPGGVITPYYGYTAGATGATITPAIANLSQPSGLAFDGNGNLWIPDESNSNVYEVTSGLTSVGTSPYALPSNAYNVAISAAENAWFATTPLTELNPSGTAVTGSPFANTGANFVALDGTSTLWTVTGGAVSRVSASGTPVGTATNFPGTLQGVSTDHNNNAWVSGSATLGEVAVTGNVATGSQFQSANTGSSFQYNAVDGAANIWVADQGAPNTVVAFNSSGTEITPMAGYTGGTTVSTPAGIAVDGAGDVWVSDFGGNSVQELIGAATPVVTPIVANLMVPYNAPASKP